MTLTDGYEIRTLSNDEFFPEFARLRGELFGHTLNFNFRDALSQPEMQALSELHKQMADAYTLNLGLYFNEKLVGWSFGRQESAEKFYMVNSAILPDHRRKGLYTSLMNTMVERVSQAGFQIIYSRHTAVNSAILIAKLKAGFKISAMEISDSFGLLVHLTYFANPVRRKIMDFRAGELVPDDEIRKYLKL